MSYACLTFSSRLPYRFVFTAASALKPVDWVMFTWMAVTTPWLFVRAPSAADVVWLGVILRVIFVPFVLYFRHVFDVCAYCILFFL